jgi:hypothetical protein
MDIKLGLHPMAYGQALRALLLGFAASLSLGGCSIERLAVDSLGDALAADSLVYSGEEDPDLVAEALPFGLKTFESLLQVSPEHEGLLLASARGFTAYGYLLQDRADRLEALDLREARRLRARAAGLYLRGRDFALRALDLRHEGFSAALLADDLEPIARTVPDDAPFLYWAGAAWGGALSADKGDLALVAQLNAPGALVGRVLELDEGFRDGSAHEFFIAYETARPGGDPARARYHYERALALSGGRRVSVHLAYAEAVALPNQDLPEFRRLLAAAGEAASDAPPDYGLVNAVARRRAAWLESRIPDLFVTLS